jgi:hypothetical protein
MDSVAWLTVVIQSSRLEALMLHSTGEDTGCLPGKLR